MFDKWFGKKTNDDSVTLARTLVAVVEQSEIAVVTVDRDFKIGYANRAANVLLTKHKAALVQQWPDFDPDHMVGSRIELFRNDPAQQRRMLDQAASQTFSTDIEIEPVTLRLRITPSFGQHGEHVGYTLEWQDVSEEKKRKQRDDDFVAQLEAIDRSQARIEFDLQERVLYANQNFLDTMGYSLDELKGKPHTTFVSDDPRVLAERAKLWTDLRKGITQVGMVERVHKNGSKVWLQANYAPVLDASGRITKIIKIASEISGQKELQDSVETLLEETQSVMHQVSHGDLTARIENDYPGKLVDLKNAVNSTLAELNRTIGSIYQVADTVGTGATEISAGNSDLSQRTEEQASSLERTSTSMAQMTSTVQQNANNAAEANRLAIEAREQAEIGGAVAGKATGAMGDINVASKRIADIISVIDEIAFQTNLLALNASVEAARAGEQGRGFAVVASEVRNLAGRSATAAKEIKDLIEDSTRKVEEGSRLVNESGKSLTDIVERVQRVSEIIGDIAQASAEQSDGIAQVGTAVKQMDDLTQQNAALVEEVAAASESLNQEATNLGTLVRKFTVTRSQGGQLVPSAPLPAPPPPPPPPATSAPVETTAPMGQTPKEPFVERRAADRPWSSSGETASDEQALTANLGEPDDESVWECF